MWSNLGLSLDRYARTDELGVPFAVTVDYQVQQDNTVTLRERDSMAQVRVGSHMFPSVSSDEPLTVLPPYRSGCP